MVAIRKYLTISKGIKFNEESTGILSDLRSLYHLEDFSELKQVKGKSSVDKTELLSNIKKLPVRERAICLVNLVTANRPNEMVRLRVKDFGSCGQKSKC